jgi:large subunit ribosomal protein L10
MQRTEKEKTVNELKEKLSRARSLFLTDFRGLNVEQMNRLRSELREKGAEYKITKNTFIRRAAEQGDFEGILDFLTGPTGLVFSYDDPVTPAKALYDLFKKLEKPKVKIIWLEGRIFDQKHLKSLATLPGREILLAQIVSGINAPIANFVGTLQGILREFVGTIDAISEEKSKAA